MPQEVNGADNVTSVTATTTTVQTGVMTTVETETTTTMVATAKPMMEMRVANLGDSGLLVINSNTGEIVWQTTEQHHYFNCPYQLGTSTDTPDDADKHIMALYSGMFLNWARCNGC